jgi:hypothetical protein
LTTIFPASTTIPVSSRPIFSILGCIPTADSTISQLIFSSPFFVLTITSHPLSDLFTFSTEELVIILIPFFLNVFSNCFETSISSTGTIFGKNSTTVTSTPIAL